MTAKITQGSMERLFKLQSAIYLNSPHAVFILSFTAKKKKTEIQGWYSAHFLIIPVYTPNYWQHRANPGPTP